MRTTTNSMRASRWMLAVCAVALVRYAFAQGGEPDAAAGKDVFEAQCYSCHNAESTEAKDGPGLKGVKNGKLPSGKAATRANILELLNAGRQGMPSFRQSLTERQKADVIAYVLTL